jgi:hypothetical protein
LPVRPGIGPFGELLAAVFTESVDAQRWEWDGTCGAVGLGPDEAQHPTDPLKRLDYFECARFQVDVVPAEAEQLASEQTEAQRQDVERIQAFAFGGQEDLADLGNGEPAVDRVLRGGDLDQLGNVARDHFLPHGGLKRVSQHRVD